MLKLDLFPTMHKTDGYRICLQSRWMLFFINNRLDLDQISKNLSFKQLHTKKKPTNILNYWNNTFVILPFSRFLSHIQSLLTIKRFKFRFVWSQKILPLYKCRVHMLFEYNNLFLLIYCWICNNTSTDYVSRYFTVEISLVAVNSGTIQFLFFMLSIIKCIFSAAVVILLM